MLDLFLSSAGSLHNKLLCNCLGRRPSPDQISSENWSFSEGNHTRNPIPHILYSEYCIIIMFYLDVKKKDNLNENGCTTIFMNWNIFFSFSHFWTRHLSMSYQMEVNVQCKYALYLQNIPDNTVTFNKKRFKNKYLMV